MYDHHSQVVIRFGTVAVLIHLGGHRLYDLTGILEICLSEKIKQSFVAKQFALIVFCFIQTIGLDEQGTSLDTVDRLALELEAWHKTDGGIRKYLEVFAVFITTTDNRRIMTGITKVEMTCLEVK